MVRHVYLSVPINDAALTARVFVKFDIGDIFTKVCRHVQILVNIRQRKQTLYMEAQAHLLWSPPLHLGYQDYQRSSGHYGYLSYEDYQCSYEGYDFAHAPKFPLHGHFRICFIYPSRRPIASNPFNFL